MGLFAAHAANLCASLIAFLLFEKFSLASRWLAGVRAYRVPAATAHDGPGLGSAAQIGVVPLSPPGVRALAFYGEWAVVGAALAVLAANAAVDAVRPGGGGPSACAGVAAALLGVSALLKAEADTLAWLRRRVTVPLVAGVVYGGSVAAAHLARPAWFRGVALTAGAADASAFISRLNPELEGVVRAPALAALIGVGAGAAAALFPAAAARAVRSGEVVCRPPAWGADLLRASLPDRAVVGAALAAPLLTALLWCPPAAAVWGLAGPAALGRAQTGALILQGALLAGAARPLVSGHLGSSLCVWYTRKHGLLGPAFEKEAGPAAPPAPPRGGGGGGAPTTPPPSLSEATKAGEVARLASRVVLYLAGKAALQVSAPAAVLAGCGMAALHGVTASPGTPGAPLARALGLGVGGAATVTWAACIAWHLLLFRIGFLTDVPAARVGA